MAKKYSSARPKDHVAALEPGWRREPCLQRNPAWPSSGGKRHAVAEAGIRATETSSSAARGWGDAEIRLFLQYRYVLVPDTGAETRLGESDATCGTRIAGHNAECVHQEAAEGAPLTS